MHNTRSRRVHAVLRDSVRSQLWPIPIAGVVAATVLGEFLPRLDRHVGGSVPGWLRSVTFGGDPDAARSLLEAVAGSLITVTSLTFSLTVVTLQLASSQFSPRLLRTFSSDVFVQSTLALFLATFTYSLTSLRSVRGGDHVFVPRIAVTVGFLLAVASVIGLILFLAHLARQIRVETMLRDVHDDASAVARMVLPLRAEAPVGLVSPARPVDAVTLPASSSGFLVRVDEERVRRVALGAGAILMLHAKPGDSVVVGTPLASAWSLTGTLDAAELDGIRDGLEAAVRLGYERTAAQDVAYGLRQLTDVANKALSPGINDPTTAVHALGHISALLCQLADRQLGPRLLTDDDERVRVVLARPDLSELLDLAVTQPRRYGAGDPQVMARLFRLLAELAWHAGEDAAIPSQLARLRSTVASSDFDDAERAGLAAHAEEVELAMLGRHQH